MEGTAIDKSRVIASARLLLAHPDAADLIIRDLAEWEDWRSLDTILALWHDQADQCAWLRRPILAYLQACPLSTARSALAQVDQSNP